VSLSVLVCKTCLCQSVLLNAHLALQPLRHYAAVRLLSLAHSSFSRKVANLRLNGVRACLCLYTLHSSRANWETDLRAFLMREKPELCAHFENSLFGLLPVRDKVLIMHFLTNRRLETEDMERGACAYSAQALFSYSAQAEGVIVHVWAVSRQHDHPSISRLCRCGLHTLAYCSSLEQPGI
jgi:hypothetical protein